MNWLQPGEEREIMDPSAYVSDLGKTLLGDDDAAAYREWTRTLGVEMSQDDVSDTAESPLKHPMVAC